LFIVEDIAYGSDHIKIRNTSVGKDNFLPFSDE